MNCADCQDALIDFSFGEREGADAASRDAAVAGHLARCPECALEYCRLVADLRGIAAAHDDVAPRPEVRAAVRAKVAQLIAPPWWRRLLTPLAVRVPLYGALAAAAIPVALWFATARPTASTADGPAATDPPPTAPSVQRYDATRTPSSLRDVL